MIENKIKKILNKLDVYLNDVLGVQISINPLEKENQLKLPFYIKEEYILFNIDVFSANDFIVVIPRNEELPKINRLNKNLKKIEDLFKQKAVLIVNNLPSYIRKRLIQRNVNFIVPGKQLYIPNVGIHLDEKKQSNNKTTKNLLPSSQILILYHILNSKDPLEKYSFSEISWKFNYSGMAITNAIRNLEVNDLCEIVGTKEKHVKFTKSTKELWDQASDLMINPVKELYYFENIPKNGNFLMSNVTALAEYTDMNPTEQIYYAIDYRSFKILINEKNIKGLNRYEGRYCLEIWKYNPELIIKKNTNKKSVDPLSLYLSIQNYNDERIELALNQLINKYIW